MNRFLGAILFWLVCSSCWAASGSWAPGFSGLNNGTMPGPGYYFIDAYYVYSSDEFHDKHGDKVNSFQGQSGRVDVNIQAGIAGFLWVSPYKVLGATYAASVVANYGRVKGSISLDELLNVHASEAGLMDTYFEPINFSWHLDRFDIFTSYAFWAPTGRYDTDQPASTGRDRWTHQLNAGMTAYLDEKKSWTLSMAPRYEIHMGQQHTDARYGDNLTLEWGIGKRLIFMNEEKTAPTGIFNVGPVGYAQWQTTNNSGADALQKDVKASVYGAGVEANYTRVNWKFATFGIRVNKEFEAQGRTQGMMGTFNFSLKF